MNLDDIDKALDYPAIKIIDTETPKNSFMRWRKFKVNNKEYSIAWWANVSYLYVEDLTIPFNAIRRTNTWPHKSKMDLIFHDRNGEVNCILKLEAI